MQQGTGIGQAGNPVKIGWSPANKVKVTVDVTDFGNIAFEAWVLAQIAALINGSPAALDTLNELAAALGNDPNFATTILNALAGKINKSGDTMLGPLVSDTYGFRTPGIDRPFVTKGYDPFTSGIYNTLGRWGLFMEPGRIALGYPSGIGSTPTIIRYNPDSSIANEWTILHAGNFNNYALPIIGGMASGALGVAPPAGAEAQLQVLVSGKPVAYLYSNADDWGLYSLDGGKIINFSRADGKVRVGGVDTAIIVQNNGGTYGIHITGNADTVDGYHASQLWRADMAAAGANWFKLPNGWIMQFGSVFVDTDSTASFLFPVAFPNECIGVFGNGTSTAISAGAMQAPVSFNSSTLNGATAVNDGIGQTFKYWAIGK